MYNNIGLMTPRGSGTSGYVQKNLAHIKRLRNRDEFVKELQQMKDNVIEAKKQANPEILLHEQKRDIEVKKLQLREALEAKETPEEEIQSKVTKLETRLREFLDKGEYVLDNIADTHARTKKKEAQDTKFTKAFGIESKDYKPGKAFDFDGQEKERLEKKYDNELKKAERLLKLKEEKRAEKRAIKEQIKQDELKKEETNKRDRSRSRNEKKKSEKQKKHKK